MFPGKGYSADEQYLEIGEWPETVSYFVGRNGSGKSRAAKLIARQFDAKLMATDRLMGLTQVSFMGWTFAPDQENTKGLPISASEREQARSLAISAGMAIDDLYSLREQPEVWLRVAAFIRRSLGRTVELRESAGFIDPYIRIGNTEYSLLRDEGHGLRELVLLLTAVYREDWTFLVVDEPELHLHPSLARLWQAELLRSCTSSERNALVVTHQPDLVRPASSGSLRSYWYFEQGLTPKRLSDFVPQGKEKRVDSSLAQYPALISQLVFSPRPVLIEGPHDRAALSACRARLMAPEQAAQTDYVECGGTPGVALWHRFCTAIGLDHRAIADLDALFTSDFQAAVDSRDLVCRHYLETFKVAPAKTSKVLEPLIQRMNREKVEANEKARARWLAELPESSADADCLRRDELLQIWRDVGQVWLHPQGTLEDVLGLDEKSANQAASKAESECSLDAAAIWSAFDLDIRGDVRKLLDAEVERIAGEISRALRNDEDLRFDSPVGRSMESDRRLVDVKFISSGLHRITVKQPSEYAGYWVDFDRDTPPSAIVLLPPSDSK